MVSRYLLFCFPLVVGVKVLVFVLEDSCIPGCCVFSCEEKKGTKNTIALWLILFLKDVHDYLHSVLHHLQSLRSNRGQCDFAL